MNIVKIAEEIQDSYDVLKQNNYNCLSMNRGKGSKAHCTRLIDMLRYELLEMKKDIRDDGRRKL